MKKRIKILLIILITIHAIDLAQSYYYLERYGYEHELNPLINNRKDLIKIKTIVIIPVIITLIFYEIAKTSKHEKTIHSIIEKTIILSIIWISIVVINNFKVMLW